MLSQNERDPEGYIIKPKEGGSRRSCFLGLFIVLAIILMLCGVVTLVAGLFYSQEVNSAISSYWKPPVEASNATELHSHTQGGIAKPKNTTTTHTESEPTLTGTGTGSKNGTSSAEDPETDEIPEGSESEDGDEDEEAEAEDDEDTNTEEGAEAETTTTEKAKVKPGKHPGKHPAGRGKKNETSSSSSTVGSILGVDGKMLNEAEEEIASFMIKLERVLENLTVSLRFSCVAVGVLRDLQWRSCIYLNLM